MITEKSITRGGFSGGVAVSKPLVFLLIILSGFTWVAGEVGEGIAGKLTLADLVGTILIGWAVLLATVSNGRVLYFPVTYRLFLPLLLVFLAGVLLSKYPARGLLEFFVHAFTFIVSLALVNVVAIDSKSVSVELLLKYCLYGSALLAVVGLLHFLFFPGWFPGAPGGLSGTFRNTGQAGSFFGLMLALIIPALLAGLIKPSPGRIFLVFLILLALLFTFKRAALLGFVVGLGLSTFRLALSRGRRDKRIALTLGMIFIFGAPLAWLIFQWAVENIPGMAWRVSHKMTADGVDDWTESFFLDNLRAAVEAFGDSPVLGVGLGNIQGVYTPRHEIHSTYFALLGTGGGMGVLAYVIFMGTFWFSIIRASVAQSVYASYLSYFLPFMLGLQISWGYTIHLRKREFWILVAICSLCMIGHRRISASRGNG